ncbi:hypothetical protein GCM10007919_00500 [Rhizobium indigoferae]|nr:hypothetical protein GCM10007919_00500 [Rhizobium indigoferae]
MLVAAARYVAQAHGAGSLAENPFRHPVKQRNGEIEMHYLERFVSLGVPAHFVWRGRPRQKKVPDSDYIGLPLPAQIAFLDTCLT